LASSKTGEGIRLPRTDEVGFFGIRLESIGGLGANVAGQILAEVGVMKLGLNGANFSSYGSEKKGSPVKAYIRFCSPEREVRTSSPVDRPHIVAVFHEGLIKTEPVAAGLLPDGVIIVNSTHSPREIWQRLGKPAATVGVVDALTISVDEGSRVNTAMLGAMARASGFIDPNAVKSVIEATLGKRYPQLLESNLRTFDRGYSDLVLEEFNSQDAAQTQGNARSGPPFGYLDAVMGGVVVDVGNSVLKDLTASRSGYIPGFHRDECVDCALCDLVCPDFCFVWSVEQGEDGTQTNRLQGIDYKYCKGCMKCIDACPTEALTWDREVEGYADTHRVPLFPQIDGRSSNAPSASG